MRIGQNPAKFVNQVAQPARVTVAVLNYIPFISGFYAEMLNVLKACLNSIWENTEKPYDLLVFDNGSCEEVCQYLLDEQAAGRIQYLILSEKNLGKGGAWNMILAGSPGEIIAYADNDVLFYKGWLNHCLEILETYPKAGMVTARPFRTKQALCTSTLGWAEITPEVKIEKGQFIPYPTFLEFNLSLGQEEAQILKDYQSSEDIRLGYQGIPAMVGASHWQFVAYKETLAQFLPFAMDRPMGQVKQLDQRINDAGYLRLMCVEPLAMNLSNTLRDVHTTSPKIKKRRFLDFPLVQKLLLGLYNKIFHWYYDQK